MVNYGPSGRCINCRERRVKCDETKPHCQRCLKMGLQCRGYQKAPRKLRYKDQSYRFLSPSLEQQNKQKDTEKGPEKKSVVRSFVSSHSIQTSLVQTAYKDVAITFFLREQVTIGRGLESTRGFFEVITPILNAEPPDSPLVSAISVVSAQHLSLWISGPTAFLSPHKTLGQSLVRLRAAIQDPVERSKPHTMLAALLLHWRENVVSVYSAQRVLRHHLHGAVSMLLLHDPSGDADPSGAMVKAYLARFLLHVQVSLALRNDRLLSEQALSQIRASYGSVAPPNPSSVLDEIGLDIVPLQAQFSALLRESSSSYPQSLPGWLQQALRVHGQLLAWVQSLPEHWHPLCLASGRDFSASCISYHEVCEVYTCCQVASIWNLWRYYRLKCIQMFLVLLDRHEGSLSDSSNGLNGTVFRLMPHLASLKKDLQDIIDDICYAVPFYLGNRTKPSSLDDFADSAIAFPSHHSLPQSDSRRRVWDGHVDGAIVSPNDHKRHAIAQGAWHLLGSLSRLLCILADPNGRVITETLRPGQHDWIREQFLRIANLLRLPFNHSSHTSTTSASGLETSDTAYKADEIARQLHLGYSIIGGI